MIRTRDCSKTELRKLLPCPACGRNDPHMRIADNTYYRVECKQCGYMPQIGALYGLGAVIIWNDRN